METVVVSSSALLILERSLKNFIDAIVPFIVFIAVVSGIISSLKQSFAKNDGAKPLNPTPQDRGQSEIEAFLTGVNSGSQTAPQRPQPPRPQPQRPVQQPANRQKPKPQRTTTSSDSQQTAKSQKAKRAGSGVAEHVESYIGDHVRSHINRDVENFVKNDIDERVKSHLGSQSSQPVEMSASDTGSKAAEDLLKTLKTPAGVRQAMILNEILSKPRALRR